jgi:hypothetical protein
MPLTAINADECARASVCRLGFVQVPFHSGWAWLVPLDLDGVSQE